MKGVADVVVVGAGPAGACTALALQRKGLSTTLIDRSPQPRWKIGETLAPEATAVLERIGAASVFQGGGHLRSNGVASAWGAAMLHNSEFIFRPEGCGWQLDRPRFERALIDAACRAGASLMTGQNVLAMRRQHHGWEVKTSGGIVSAAHLVDASGSARVVARRLRLRHVAIDRLVSLHFRLSGALNPDRDTHTLVESVPDGWWYTALVPGGARIVSLQTDADLLAKDSWRKDEWMHGQIRSTRNLFDLLGSRGYRLIVVPSLVSARSSRLERFFGEGWIAVGDAAMTVDPLCGRGIFMAMQTAVMAADAIATAGAHAMEAYGVALEHAWNDYLQGRCVYYQAEMRWSDRPFWQRRHRSDFRAAEVR